MLKALKNFFNKSATEGMKVPFVYDGDSQKPSVTLLFAYVTFILAVISVICLHFWKELITASATSIIFWIVSVVFYRLRRLDKAKINIKDQSIELDGEDNKNETSN